MQNYLSDGSACEQVVHHSESAWSDSMEVDIITESTQTALIMQHKHIALQLIDLW